MTVITFLEGVLVEKHPTRIVLNVGGVGYEVSIPLSSFDRLPAPEEPCHVLTYDYVREDTHQLFGFMSEQERAMFQTLMTISGIGAKLALSALSGMAVRDIKTAALEGDVKRLSSISGIGKKMAERIAVELRHKITTGEALQAVAGPGEGSADDAVLRDGVMALIALGYKQAEARKMIQDVIGKSGGADVPVEEVIRKALAR